MKKTLYTDFLLLSVLTVGLAACSETTVDTSAYDNDSAIASQIKADIHHDKALKKEKVTIVVSQGVVELDGTVSSLAADERLADLVRQVQGVRLVQDNLETP